MENPAFRTQGMGKINGYTFSDTVPEKPTAEGPEPGADPPQPPQRSSLRIWQDYSQGSTFHGVRYITNGSSSLCRRILWSMLVMSAFCYLTYQIYLRTAFFLSDPVLVKIDRMYNRTLRFPVVVICNQNSFKLTSSVSNESDHFTKLVSYSSNTLDDVTKSIKGFNKTSRGLNTASEASLNRFLNRTWEDIVRSLGHKAYDLIARCYWRDKICSWHDFTPIVTDHGLCYSFNGIKNDTEYVSYAAGSLEGLRLLINIEQYEYTDGPHSSSGVRLLMHEQGDIPMINTLADGIGPGTHTFVGIDLSKTHRVSRSQSVCTNGKPLVYFTNYTELACREDCRAKKYVKACGCRKSSRWRDDGSHLCTVKEKLECESKNYSFSDQDVGCIKCEVICNTATYNPVFSALKTNENDYNRMSQKYWNGVKKDFTKAQDIRVDTDETLYNKYRNLIKNFSETAIASRSVYGKYKEFINGMQKYLSLIKLLFDAVTVDLTEDLNSHFSTLETFYEREFVGPAELRFPALDVRSMVLAVQSGIGALRLDQANKNDSYLLVFASIKKVTDSVEASSDALKEILDAYSAGKPVVGVDPNLTTVFFSYYGSYKEKLVNEAVEQSAKITYYETAIETAKKLREFSTFLDQAFKTNAIDMGEFNTTNDTVMLLLNRLGIYRREMIEKVFKYPLTAVKNYQTDLVPEFRSLPTYYRIFQSDYTFLSDWYPNEKDLLSVYEKWVDSLTDKLSGRLNLSSMATELAREPGINEAVYEIRNFFNKAFVRFERAETNNEDFRTAIGHIFWSIYSKDIYKDFSTDELTGQEMIGNFNITWLKYYANATDLHDLMKLNNVTFQQFLLEQDGKLKDVHEDLTAQFEQLKMAMEAYSTSLIIDGEFFKKNYAQVDIYFQEMFYEDMSQQPAYDGAALLSDIGGSMGLLIGGSCLTVFELLDTLLTCCKFLLRKTKTGKQKESEAQTERSEMTVY